MMLQIARIEDPSWWAADLIGECASRGCRHQPDLDGPPIAYLLVKASVLLWLRPGVGFFENRALKPKPLCVVIKREISRLTKDICAIRCQATGNVGQPSDYAYSAIQIMLGVCSQSRLGYLRVPP